MAPIEQLAAGKFAEQVPPTEMMEIFQPLMELIRPALGIVSAIVGGLFGLYLIYIIIRLYYERKRIKILKDIRYDLDYLNQHFNLPYSQRKKFRKKIMPLEKFGELEKEEAEKIREKEKIKITKKKEREKKKLAKKKKKKR